jgi:(2Fe-2S) ferredoxin
MPRFERHVFVCCNEREPGHPRGCCSARNSVAIREALKAAIKQRGLAGRVRANQSGCLDQCEHGVTIVVYPDAVWYGFVKLEDVDEIVEKHLIGGQPVQRLVLPETCINTPRCPHRGGGTVQLAAPR